MIDVQVVDAWFEASKTLLGGPVRFAVFDRGVLLSLDQLCAAVNSETGETCSRVPAEEGGRGLVPATAAAEGARRDGRTPVRPLPHRALRAAGA
jgi:hypothetical protein